MSNAYWVPLVCRSGSSFALLNRLAVDISEIPEIGDWFVHAAQQVILDFASIVNSIEVNLPFVSKLFPERTL